MRAVPHLMLAQLFIRSPVQHFFLLASATAMPYTIAVQTVIETKEFLAAVKRAGMGDEEREALISLVANEPTVGDLMQGTGGCRKLRFRRAGTGKSGGYRTVTFYGGTDIPVIMLTVFGKNERSNLTKAERNALAKATVIMAEKLRKKSK